MTTPAQYEAAIRLLADLRGVALKAEANAPDEQMRRKKHELAVGLDSALAIVREAAERAGHGPAWNDLARRAQRREGTCPDCGWAEDDSLALESHACPASPQPVRLGEGP